LEHLMKTGDGPSTDTQAKSADDYLRFVPKVYKKSPKGFTLFCGREELVEQELSHEYPYEYANVSVVFPLARARLDQRAVEMWRYSQTYRGYLGSPPGDQQLDRRHDTQPDWRHLFWWHELLLHRLLTLPARKP